MSTFSLQELVSEETGEKQKQKSKEREREEGGESRIQEKRRQMNELKGAHIFCLLQLLLKRMLPLVFCINSEFVYAKSRLPLQSNKANRTRLPFSI